MAHDPMFCLAPSARLFAGDARVALPPNAPAQGFRIIPANPPSAALGLLVEAVSARDAFCVAPEPLPRDCTASAPDFLTLTGGSTGAPKAILRSQASWIASFELHARLFDLPQLGSTAILGSLGHSLSLFAVLEGLHLGLDVHVLTALPAARQRDSLSANQIRVLYATPTQLRLLAHNTLAPIPSLSLLFCGGGTLDAHTQDALQGLFPNAEIHRFYGAAETSFVTMADRTTPAGSVGKPYADVDVRLLDGALWVRSPYLFTGYIPPNTAPPEMRDGFLNTGDLARADAEGHLWITGRASRQVSIADQLVSPEAVEALVASHPLGGPCAVLALPDKLRGHRLALVLQGPKDPARDKAVRQACIDSFGPLIAPRKILFQPELPRLESGKTDLTQLAQLLETST